MSPPASRRLYVLPTSPYCRKVCWVLGRKRLEYQPVGPNAASDRELESLVETARVPVLVDGEAVIAGSTPIAFYLERIYGEPSLFPTDPRKRNQAVTFNEFADRGLGWPVVRLRGGDVDREIDALDAPAGSGDELREALRRSLEQVREAIGRGALDPGVCHLGDIAVAAHLAACRELAELGFDETYPDLVAFSESIHGFCEPTKE